MELDFNGCIEPVFWTGGAEQAGSADDFVYAGLPLLKSLRQGVAHRAMPASWRTITPVVARRVAALVAAHMRSVAHDRRFVASALSPADYGRDSSAVLKA